MPSLGKYFPHLRHLSVASDSQATRTQLSGHVVQKLPFLESLKLSNVDFEFDKEVEKMPMLQPWKICRLPYGPGVFEDFTLRRVP